MLKWLDAAKETACWEGYSIKQASSVTVKAAYEWAVKNKQVPFS